MADRIVVERLRIPTRIGVTEAERAEPQVIIVNLELVADLAAAGASDDLADTVDYDSLVTTVADLVRGTEVHLLETLADRVARAVAAAKGVKGVTVELSKEKVPVREDVEKVAVRIERTFG